MEKYNTKIYNTNKYNTHVQIKVKFSSPKISIMDQVPKQQYVDIEPISLHNYDHINAQLDNKGKHLVVS